MALYGDLNPGVCHLYVKSLELIWRAGICGCTIFKKSWLGVMTRYQGSDSVQRWHLTSIANPIVEIRRSDHRLISTMGFLILIRHLYIEWGPRLLVPTMAAWWHAPFKTNVSSSRGALGLLGSFIKILFTMGPNLLAPYQWVSARKT